MKRGILNRIHEVMIPIIWNGGNDLKTYQENKTKQKAKRQQCIKKNNKEMTFWKIMLVTWVTDSKGDKLEIHNHRVDSSTAKLSGRNIKLFVSHNF